MANKELAILLTAKNMASGPINKVSGDIGRMDRIAGHAGRGVRNLGSNLASLGVVAGAALGGVVIKSISAASDLNETISKSGVVFQAASAEVLAWSKTSAAAIGLSQNAALGAAATYGNLFVSMGLAADKSADMSMKLVNLAGDLASFNNIDPTEAAEKLRAGLTGESEPLKSLGININETIIKAKALELGLIKTSASTADLKLKTIAYKKATAEANVAIKTYGANSTQALKAIVKQEKAQETLEKSTNKIPGTLDAATKAQAAYALIFEQSATAQGDFARTSGGLANQQRILRANLDNLSATLGTALLPKIAELVTKINELAVSRAPDIERLAAKLPALFDKLMSIVTAIPWGAVESAMGVMGMGAEALLTAFTSMPSWVQTAVLTGWGLNKLTGGALGGIAGELAKGLFSGRGATPANPLFVADVAGGLPGVVPVGGGSILGKLASLFPATLFATAVIAAAVPIGEAFAAALPAEWKGPNGAGESESQRRIREGKEAQGDTTEPNRGSRGGATRMQSEGGVRLDRTGTFEASAVARASAAGLKPTADQITRTAAATMSRADALAARQIAAAQQNAFMIRDAICNIVIPPTTVTVRSVVTAMAQANRVTNAPLRGAVAGVGID